jgi:hypothetical protein
VRKWPRLGGGRSPRSPEYGAVRAVTAVLGHAAVFLLVLTLVVLAPSVGQTNVRAPWSVVSDAHERMFDFVVATSKTSLCEIQEIACSGSRTFERCTRSQSLIRVFKEYVRRHPDYMQTDEGIGLYFSLRELCGRPLRPL